MYNSEQKEEFLNTIINDNSYKSFNRVFKSIESMEESFGKDICDMSVDEVLVVMDLKTGTRITNTDNTMSLLRSYVNWCIQNGKTTSENNFDKIDSSEVDKKKIFKSKYIKNPEELDEMISIVFKECYEYNYDVENPKELCVRLVYLGLTDEEIVMLKKDDVDYDNKVIKSPIYKDVEYAISDRILNLCKFCSEQENVMYLAKGGNRSERLCNNDYLLRQRIGTLRGNPENRPINKTNVIRRIKEFSDKYTNETDIYKNITSSKLRESYMYYQIHSSKNPTKFINDAIKCDLIMREYKDASVRQIGEKIRQIKRSYETWENAFY